MANPDSTVDESLSQDLVHLNSFSEEQQLEISEITLQFLVDSKGSELQNKLGEFGEKYRINPAVLKVTVRALLLFLQRGIREGWSADQIEVSATALNLEAGGAHAIKTCWAQHASDLTSTLLSKIISANQLIDVDWSFGVTAATDDSDKVGRTFLQMKLTVDRGENGPQDVFMELSLEQFYQFMAQMEKAKAYLDFVSA